MSEANSYNYEHPAQIFLSLMLLHFLYFKKNIIAVCRRRI